MNQTSESFLSIVKDYRLENGERLASYIERKNKNHKYEWAQNGNVISFLVYVKGLRSPNIFRWEISNNKIFATNGSSITLTPELDKRRQEIDNRKQSVPVELMRIYNFVKQYHLEEDLPIEIVLDRANKEFGLNQGEIEEIYLKVDNELHRD